MKFDHIALACEDLAAGVAYVEAALRLRLPEAVGRHALMGTQNRLLSLGGAEYLEVIAIDPDAPPPGRARWFGLDQFSGAPRIVAWVAAMDLPEGAKLAPARLEGAGEVLDFERGPYRWQMAVPKDGLLPFAGLQPAQILWQSPHPALQLPPSPCRLAGLRLTTPEPSALQARLAGFADPRLRIEAGAHPQIRAEISTPEGLCLL